MSARYFEIVTSASAFHIRIKTEQRSDGALCVEDLQASDSNWGRRSDVGLSEPGITNAPEHRNIIYTAQQHMQRIHSYHHSVYIAAYFHPHQEPRHLMQCASLWG
ncbi:hypothetical protein FVER53590_29286 [Fusarium verticillioides]|nr:hypothetical protein FVER53590_29286 [Fusarium verticillioides]